MPSPSVWRWRWLALLLILLTAAVRIVYLGFHCPLDLAPDEAHYWDWSRHLDWSYYSKGPLVALLIRGSCAVFGDTMLAVRLPAVVCGSLMLAALYILTVQILRREWLACAVVAAALTFPAVAAGSAIMTIDSPYCCCWSWALVLAWQALQGHRWAWPAAGLTVGVGILAKYTMVLFLPSLGLFLLFSPEHRRLLVRPRFWILVGVAAVWCLPIVIWNTQHGWVSFRHVNNLAGVNAVRWHWQGPLLYLAVQFALLLGWWFAGWVQTMIAHGPWRETDPGKRYLWWLSAPMFVVFLVFSIKNGGGEPNWPIAAYLSGMVLMAGWLSDQITTSTGWYRRLAMAAVTIAMLVGIVGTVLSHLSHLSYPILAQVVGEPTESDPTPLRRLDPTCRLRGWRTLASEVEAVRQRLRERGEPEPLVVGASWSLPGELGFYLPDHPQVYSLGPLLGDRRSQYDLWRPNPTSDPDQFAGQTVIVVGSLGTSLVDLFERVERPCTVTHYESGHPVARWAIMVGHGYRGPTLAQRFHGDRY